MWPHGDPRLVIESILADARYERAGRAASAQASWLDMMRAWAVRGVRALLHGFDHALGAHNAWETAIGFALVAAAFGLLACGIYALVRSSLRDGMAQRLPGAPTAASTAAELGADALRAAALAAARERRYRDAAALLFASAVRALDEAGRVAYDPARTPGEYRGLVRDPLFDVLTRDAAVALFAPAEPGADLFERMHAAYNGFFASRPR